MLLFFILNTCCYFITIIFKETHCHLIIINVNITRHDVNSTEKKSPVNYNDLIKQIRYYGELYHKNNFHMKIAIKKI